MPETDSWNSGDHEFWNHEIRGSPVYCDLTRKIKTSSKIIRVSFFVKSQRIVDSAIFFFLVAFQISFMQKSYDEKNCQVVTFHIFAFWHSRAEEEN